MSEEKKITVDALLKRIGDLGFTEVDTEPNGNRHYSRQTIVGAPPDSDGDKVFVFLNVRGDGFCDVSLTSPNKNGWVDIEYTDLDLEFFFRNLKTLERQIVYAWRELAD